MHSRSRISFSRFRGLRSVIHVGKGPDCLLAPRMLIRPEASDKPPVPIRQSTLIGLVTLRPPRSGMRLWTVVVFTLLRPRSSCTESLRRSLAEGGSVTLPASHVSAKQGAERSLDKTSQRKRERNPPSFRQASEGGSATLPLSARHRTRGASCSLLPTALRSGERHPPSFAEALEAGSMILPRSLRCWKRGASRSLLR
jgi:hypothetical protein